MGEGNSILPRGQIVARKEKGKFACRFHSFLQVFERGFLQKISHVDEEEWQITVTLLVAPVNAEMPFCKTGHLRLISPISFGV